METPRFAQVVIFVPLDRRQPQKQDSHGPETLIDFSPDSQTFTYGIPYQRRGQYQAGQVVWVPFGRSRRQGVIIRLTDDAPAGVKIKPLDDPVTVNPALTPEQIELALWLSRTYLAPLSECAKLILPPGFGAHSLIVVEYTPGAPITAYDTTPVQQALLLHLQQHGPIPLRELRKLDRRLTADDVLGVLIKEGLVRLRDQIQGKARPTPKLLHRARLAIAPAEIEQALTAVGRRSKQAEILQWLTSQPDCSASVAEIRAALGCSLSPIKKLRERGWIRQEEHQISLNLEPEAVPRHILILRGSERYLPVLQTLARMGTAPVPLPELYDQIPTDIQALKRLAKAGLIELSEVEVWRNPLAGHLVEPDTPPTLTDDQQRAWVKIQTGLEEWVEAASPPEGKSPPVYLLHGVTGSGKTELYLRTLARVLAQGRQGIVLVPEISLTPQTVRRFIARFPGRVAIMHSKLSDGERYDTWQRARQGEFDVIVGSRSALFTPFSRLGLIVVDEEHDTAYKQIRTPRYHARDAAIELARLSGAITLLGSATPSLESMFAARRGLYTLLTLPRRVQGHGPVIWVKKDYGAELQQAGMLDLPPVAVVDMREELRAGNRSMFSRQLHQALQEVLDRHEQAILFLNRRGSATFVLCRDCGYVMRCPRCGIPLTYHGYGNVLICHHCNYRQTMPKTCPRCGSPRFKEFGAGTQRLLDALKEEFPTARPLRWDRDTTGGKTSHEEILQDFIDHKADVLVGTQMIAKGLDLPLVTLVGVLSADVGLFLPDFRAAERVFQVLTQVAGRAGRSALGGKVIFQTYQPRNYAIVAASQHDFTAFYRQEMHFRQENGYPPFRRLTRLLYLDSNRDRCQRETKRVASLLEQRARLLKEENFSIIGPAPAFFSKERGKFRWHLLFRSPQPNRLLASIPLTANWRIDVDPIDTL